MAAIQEYHFEGYTANFHNSLIKLSWLHKLIRYGTLTQQNDEIVSLKFLSSIDPMGKL